MAAVLTRPRPIDEAPRESVPRRLHSLDALRGVAVVGMLLVDNRGSQAMPSQFVHTTWNGMRVSDLVFPAFLLAVGMSMGISSRTADAKAALVRTAKLAALGCLLVVLRDKHIGLSTGVLQHIAAAYFICWLILRLPRRAQTPVAIGLLGIVWAAYAFAPAPGVLPGTYQAGHTIGEWFTNNVLHMPFSAETPQSYLPSAITTYVGVLTIRAFRNGLRATSRLAAICVAAGLALTPWIPLNKRLWTPSYALLTAGIAAAVFVCLHLLIEHLRLDLRPLVALGRNAIVVFAFSEIVFRGLLAGIRPQAVGLLAHVGGEVIAAVGYAALSVVAAWWLCDRLDRRGVVIRV